MFHDSPQIDSNQFRSEEVSDIVQRIPDKFRKWVTAIVLLIFCMLVLFGVIIKYPDVVRGSITINSNYSVVKIVANTSGKLQLVKTNKSEAREGDYIAIIQNTSDLMDVATLIKILEAGEATPNYFVTNRTIFPDSLKLGELNASYYKFITSYNQILDYEKDNIMSRQEEILQKQLESQSGILQRQYGEKELLKSNLELSNRQFSRDSILKKNDVIADAEFEKSKATNLANLNRYLSTDKEISSTLFFLEDIRNKLQQLRIQRYEREKEMRLTYLDAYFALRREIDSWEQKYILKAPINGNIEFLKFWSNNQFVKTGEELFAIVPKQDSLFGQMYLPGFGAGKVVVGQRVNIKLDNYPYLEYGYAKGEVKSISMIASSSVESGDQSSGDNYLVEVWLPNGLKTSFSTSLPSKSEIKGQGEIITNDRRLVMRLFDNLHYLVSQ